MSEPTTIIVDELFSIPEVLSPRLAWIKKHEIRTHHHEHSEMPWAAWLPAHDYSKEHSGCYHPAHGDQAGFGMTEEEAVIDLAKTQRMPLWNEPANHPELFKP